MKQERRNKRNLPSVVLKAHQWNFLHLISRHAILFSNYPTHRINLNNISFHQIINIITNIIIKNKIMNNYNRDTSPCKCHFLKFF